MTIYNWLKLENLKEGDLLDSSTRDSIILVGRHPVGWYVMDCEYDEQKQEFCPVGNKYILTNQEIARDFEIS